MNGIGLRGRPLASIQRVYRGEGSTLHVHTARVSRRAVETIPQQIESWQRLELLPGLELLLRPSASPAAVRAAQAICREYLGG
jgi:hypothetical protein